MSVTTEFIKLKSGNIRGGMAIRDAMSRVKLAWTLKMIAELDPLLVRVPFRTGALYAAVKGRLDSSPAGKVDIGAPGVEYAGYVDSMTPPINWTNSQSVYHFLQWLLKNAERIRFTKLREAIRQEGLAALTGKTVNELAGMMLE